MGFVEPRKLVICKLADFWILPTNPVHLSCRPTLKQASPVWRVHWNFAVQNKHLVLVCKVLQMGSALAKCPVISESAPSCTQITNPVLWNCPLILKQVSLAWRVHPILCVKKFVSICKVLQMVIARENWAVNSMCMTLWKVESTPAHLNCPLTLKPAASACHVWFPQHVLMESGLQSSEIFLKIEQFGREDNDFSTSYPFQPLHRNDLASEFSFQASQIPDAREETPVSSTSILLSRTESIPAPWNFPLSWKRASDVFMVKAQVSLFPLYLQSFVDERCSGKLQCQFRGVDPVFHGIAPCPLELSSYLQASYTCVPGT